MVPTILLWFVSHVLNPKTGGFPRIDNAEVHLVYILLNKIRINWANYFVSQMFSIKDCNKGNSFCYVSMIVKILNYFNIWMPNLQYKSLSMAQEFSQRILINMGYFWDENHRVYYFRVGKSGRKMYNFDDPTEFVDATTEQHVVDDQPIGISHGVPQGDAFMQDVEHEDGQGNRFRVEYGDQASIMYMLQNMQLRQDERYEEDCRRRDAFEATQVEKFCLLQEHMTTQDSIF